MRVLLLGSGGRESALAWALSRSPAVTEVVAAPGNPGIARLAETVAVDAGDPAGVVALARRVSPALVVVGPEAPLVAGVGDALRDEGVRVFGPSAAAARIEGSKSFAKELMGSAGVPTARWRAFESLPEAVAYLDTLPPPYVVKADGLAAGKGVVVTADRDEAVAALSARLVEGAFGGAGRCCIVEEYLDGEEASLIALSDGAAVAPLAPAQDYKRAFDGDAGPNTGGMGSYSPVPSCPDELAHEIVREIVEPTVAASAAAGAPFLGALYAGIALTSSGPKVLEFNVRFGDPEAQALLPRLRSDFGYACAACASGDLSGIALDFSEEVCVTVVLASAGYPGRYETGRVIEGLGEAEAMDSVLVFHAGTARRGGEVVTAGGRVVAVSALGRSFAEARRRAYEAAAVIRFEGKQLRSDIALRAEKAQTAERG